MPICESTFRKVVASHNAGFSVESYERLAELAIERKKFKSWEVDELLEVAKEWPWQADALKKYADANNLAWNWQI